MTLFQFVVFTKALAGARIDSLAKLLEISRTYLSTILWGHRPLTMTVKLRASKLFHVPLNQLDRRITERDARRFARSAK